MSREEALYSARKLLRGFAAAPDPRQHAQRLYGDLSRAVGWSAREEAEISALGAWLQTRPAHVALKPRCAAVLAQLG